MWLFVLPLYIRIKKGEALEDFNRERIYRYIEEHLGGYERREERRGERRKPSTGRVGGERGAGRKKMGARQIIQIFTNGNNGGNHTVE